VTIDPFTFGGSYAGEILAEILDQEKDRKLIRRVSTFLHHTFAGFTQLSAVGNDSLFTEFVVLWRNERTSKVKFRDDIDSLVKSIIVGVSRDWLRGVEQEEEHDD